MSSNEQKSANMPAADEAILKHPYVEHLHNALRVLASELALQKEKVEELSAELRRLQKLPGKPKIEASKLDEQPKAAKKGGAKEGKRPGSGQRRKKKNCPWTSTGRSNWKPPRMAGALPATAIA